MTHELPSRLVNATIDVNDPGRLQRIVQPFERTHFRHDQRVDVVFLGQRPAI